MFAIFKSGGKQYKAKAGDILKLEKLEGEVGSAIQLGDVLLFGAKSTDIGANAAKAKVTAEILEQGKGEKVIVFKKKRRHNYRRKNGHRQLQTVVRITEITSPAGETVKAEAYKPKAKKEAPVKATKAEKATKAAAAPKAEKKAAVPKAKKAAAPKADKAETTAKKPAAKKAATSKKKED